MSPARRVLLCALLPLAWSCTRDLDLPGNLPQSIDGRVVAEEPGTGRTLPAAGARVEFAGTGLATLADAQGLFSFSNPPPAPRALLVTWASAGTTTDRQRVFRSATLDKTGAVHLGDVLVAPNAQLSGRITLADAPRDSPLLIGTVVFVPHYPYAAVTGSGGAFLLPHLPPGAVSIGISRPGYAVGGVASIDLAPGASVSLEEIALQPAANTAAQTGTIQGKALRADGTPASGATVSAALVQGGAPKTASVGADGAFSIAGLPLGAYAVTVTDAAAGTNAQVGGVLVAPGASAGGTADLGALTLSKAPPLAAPPPGPPPLPVARPGPDQTVLPGATVTLDASASDGVGLVFDWSADKSSVTFAQNHSAAAAHTSFVAPLALPPVSITLSVTDSLNQTSAPAILHLSITPPAPPVAAIGADQIVAPGVAVLLDGSASTGQGITFHWSTATAGVTFAVNDSTLAAHTSLVAPSGLAPVVIALVVTDQFGQASPAAVGHVFPDPLPVPVLTAPATIRTAVLGLLDASGTTDPNPAAVLNYAFAATASPPGSTLAFSAGPLPSQRAFTASAEGTYKFQVNVDDGHVSATSAEVTVLVSNINHAPTAVISAPLAVAHGADIALDGSLSSDPDPGDAAGLVFRWTAIGTAPAPANAALPVVHVTAPQVAATLTYTLVVTDSHGAVSNPATAVIGVSPPPNPPPPAAPVVSLTIPPNGSSSVPTTASIEIDYSASLSNASVTAATAPVTVTVSGQPVPGLVAYAEVVNAAGTRHALTFTPSLPFPSGTAVTVTVAALKDPFGQASGTATFSFTTDVPTWVDISPPDPKRTGGYAGAPAGGVDYSEYAVGPAIVTGASGSYLLDVENGNAPQTPGLPPGNGYGYGAILHRWDLGSVDAGTIDGGYNWNVVTNLTQQLESANACCSGFGPRSPPTNAADAPFWRAYLGVDNGGLPLLAFDATDQNIWYSSSTSSNVARPALPRVGASLASDGINNWIAYRGCDYVPNSSSNLFTEIYLAVAGANNPIGPSADGGLNDVALISPVFSGAADAGQPLATACSAVQAPAFDLWFGPPSLVGGAGKVYLLVASKPAPAQPYAMGLYSRAAGDLTAPIPGPITDANHLAANRGALNQAAVGQNSWTGGASSPFGPVLAFVEGAPGSQHYRITRYDEASLTFVDPLTNSAIDAAGGTSGSSAISPQTIPQLDSQPWASPGPPAVLVAGASVYLAWQALSGSGGGITGHRVFVAHSDPVLHKWVLDPDTRSLDGALNVHAGCDGSPPTIALVDGLPAVAWGESCVISGQAYTQNFVYVRRLQ